MDVVLVVELMVIVGGFGYVAGFENADRKRERDEMGVRNDEVEVRALRVGDEFRAGTMWLKITKVDARLGNTKTPVHLEVVDQWGDPVTYVLPAGMTVVRA